MGINLTPCFNLLSTGATYRDTVKMMAAQNLGTRAVLLTTGAYLVGINAASVGLFYYDKQQAVNHEWRVRPHYDSKISLPHITRNHPPKRAELGSWSEEKAKQKLTKIHFHISRSQRRRFSSPLF